jgi:hypothetical protein
MSAGMDGDELRALVRQTLREALPGVLSGLSSPSGGDSEVRAGSGELVEPVVVATDGDLAALVRRVLVLADDPVTADRLRGGLIRFRLVGTGASASCVPASASRPVHRVDRGAVLERHVRAAAAAGAGLVVGPRAVLTPLARERARASGVEVVVEPRGGTNRRDG